MARRAKIQKVINFKVDPQTVKDHADHIETLKQMARDQSMKVASYGKVIERDGIHNAAFFLAIKLKRMERSKAIDYLKSFDVYRLILLADTERDFIDDLERGGDESESSIETAPETETEELSAYDQGMVAGKAGRSFDQNPYDADEEFSNHDDWEKGWRMGQTANIEKLSPKRRRGNGTHAAA